MGRRITRLETAVDKAFAELEKYNIRTGTPKSMMWNCCQTCSWSNFDSPEDKNVVFYHIQDLEGLREIRRENKWNEGYNEELEEEYLYLAWTVDYPEVLERVIIPTLLNHRINVKHDGTKNSRLRLTLNMDYMEDKGEYTKC